MKIFGLFVIIFSFGQLSWAKPERITLISSLYFENEAQGSMAEVVPPGSSENPNNASFYITGRNFKTFSIMLPASITMTTGTGGTSEKKIIVNSFQSNPSTTGVFSSNGEAYLYVGATRSALLTNQAAGSYTGVFTVTIIF